MCFGRFPKQTGFAFIFESVTFAVDAVRGGTTILADDRRFAQKTEPSYLSVANC